MGWKTFGGLRSIGEGKRVETDESGKGETGVGGTTVETQEER